MEVIQEIKDRFNAADEYLSTKRDLWDDVEKLFHNQLNDSVSSTAKSQVFDPKLSTLAIERSYRVMSQLPVGKVRAISKNDLGASILMNMILDKYIFPNAKAQFDFLTKLRMVDLYSNIYGNFFALIDWDVRKDGYIGPDMWMLNIRDVFPQVGAVSIDDSDFVIVRTWKPLSFFKNLNPKDKGYKNVDKIVTKLSKISGSKENRDQDSIGKREDSQYPTQTASKKAGFYEVWTQYEKDRWVDYVKDADLVLRDIENPQKNGELPVVCKYSIPLLDDFMGMGDFERGKPMQMVINSVWNLYLDACKMSIYPPVVINKDTIANSASFKWGPAEKWIVRGQLDNSVKTIQLSPQGIPTFNNTYHTAAAALLNAFGTTDTSLANKDEAGYGRTPQALKMQSQRENTRDNADRFFMERFLTESVKKMVNLVSNKQSSAITLRLFEEDIKQLSRVYTDFSEYYDEKTGKLSINKDITGSILYDYEIVPGSTYLVDQEKQQANLTMLMDLFSKNPNLLQLLGNDYEIKFGEIFKRIIANSGIQDWDKIVIEKTEEEKQEDIIQQAMQQFSMAQQGINQIPPEQVEQPQIPSQQGGNF